MSEHTPTPWKYERPGNETEDSDDFFSIIGPRINQICGNQVALTPMKKDEDEANAAFIVKAVNSYAHDQEIIQGLLEAAEELLSCYRDNLRAGPAIVNKWIKAISKAQERKP